MVVGTDAAGFVFDAGLWVQAGTLGSDFVIVTVDGGFDPLLPQAATVTKIADTATARQAVFAFTETTLGALLDDEVVVSV